MNELITIGNFPTSAIAIREFKDRLKDQILEGEISAGDAKCLLKSMEIVVKDLQDDAQIKEAFSDFADRYTEKTFKYKGMSFTKTEKKVYNYQSCGDPTYDDLIKEQEKIKVKINEREELLKALKEPMFDKDGIEIKPPTYTWQTGLTLKPL